jgi:hypothetical protein
MTLAFFCFASEYEAIQREQAGRRRSRNIPVSEFVDWLRDRVQSSITAGEEVDLNLTLMSNLPARDAEEYSSMWAYRNHYCCLPDDESITNETFDSGVFVMSSQGCQASPNDTNIVHAELPYGKILKR